MRKLIFRIRELVWWFVAELEDILYPYTDDYDNHVYASRSPEIDDISELRDQLKTLLKDRTTSIRNDSCSKHTKETSKCIKI